MARPPWKSLGVPLENYTTYTETDLSGLITVASATHIDFQAKRNTTAYLVKDKGTAYFGDFTHHFRAMCDFLDIYDSGFFYGLSTRDAGDFKTLQSDTAAKTIGMDAYKSDALVRSYELNELYNGVRYVSAVTGLAASTWYYFKVVKSGTSLKCYIYTDAAETNLVATLSLTLHANHTFQWVYACGTYNIGGADRPMNLDIENLRLG